MAAVVSAAEDIIRGGGTDNDIVAVGDEWSREMVDGMGGRYI